MASIHYLSELDKVKAYHAYRPIVKDLTKEQLEIVLLCLINGVELDYAFDLVIGVPKERLRTNKFNEDIH